jgi:hypothetical protein
VSQRLAELSPILRRSFLWKAISPPSSEQSFFFGKSGKNWKQILIYSKDPDLISKNWTI